MEDFGKRTTLILVTAFLIANLGLFAVLMMIANLGLFAVLMKMKSSPAANCTWRAPNMICTDDR